jgi:Outer membrane receptor proteins, mostly Fe transport
MLALAPFAATAAAVDPAQSALVDPAQNAAVDTAQVAPVKPAQVAGRVQDALGRPLAGVALLLKSASGATVGKTASDADGRFAFSGVARGTYAVVADKHGFSTATSIVSLNADAGAETTLTLAAQQALEVQVAATRLNRSRNGLSPKTGGSVYRFDAKAVQSMPQGDSTAFNQVLLQAPGVANDSYGQLHIRGDHANLQYRVDGVILPEGISGFGQALDTRFASSIDLLTGALPAQYGYRTAGVIEIATKNRFEPGGKIDFYGGSHATFNPSIEYGNSVGKLSYYVSGSLLGNDVGIENPTPGRDAIHDQTRQAKGFAYLSYLLSPTTRVSAMFGSYDGKFQIPNNPGQTPDPNFLAAAGIAGFDSATLDENQRESNRYGVVSLQSTIGDNFDYQVSLFTRYTKVHFSPDPIGDLVFNGVASDVLRSSASSGVQADGSYRLNAAHTLRMGLFASTESVRSDNASTVFPVDTSGNVTGAPFTLNDNSASSGNSLLGAYLQDEWRATDKLTVNYGARVDQVDAFVKESQLSPRLGLVYKATPATTLHAGYARYFTPPPTELVAPTTVALFDGTSNAQPGSLDSPVKSERSHYFDLGATHQLTHEVALGIDTFYKRSTHLIDEGQFGQALIFTPFNYARGKVYGVELTADYKSDNLAAYLNLAHTVSLATDIESAQFAFDPDELAYIADHWVHADHDQAYTASAGASYTWSDVRWSADAIFGSGLRAGFANTEHLPAYVQVDLGATHRFRVPGLGAIDGRLAIVNAFDRVYEIRDGSGIGVGAPQYGPRRGVFVGVSKSF